MNPSSENPATPPDEAVVAASPTPGDAPASTPADAGDAAAEGSTETADAPAADAAVSLAPPALEASPAEVATELKQAFPALFSGRPKPVKLRIQADIQQRLPGRFSKNQLSIFLRRHTGSTGYLIALTQAKERFDLDGQPAGELTEEHLVAAREELARRRNLQQERNAEMEQQRHNRANLLRDFERTTLTEANFCALKGVTPEELPALLEIARKEAAEAPPPRDDRGPRHDRGPRDARPGQRPGGQPSGDRPGGQRPGARPGGQRPDNRGGRPPQGGRGPDARGPRPPRPPRPDGAERKPQAAAPVDAPAGAPAAAPAPATPPVDKKD